MSETTRLPLFMKNHIIAPIAESEPVENIHYLYDCKKQRSIWLSSSMSTTTTTCGKANRVDDTQKD